MKQIALALCLLFAPCAFSQTLVVKDKGKFLVITPDCEVSGELERVQIKRLAVGGKIILYTSEKRYSCSIQNIQPYKT